MDINHESQIQNKVADEERELLRKEIKQLRAELQHERDKNMRFREREEMHKEEVEKLKKMLTTYDVMFNGTFKPGSGATEILKRSTEKRRKSLQPEDAKLKQAEKENQELRLLLKQKRSVNTQLKLESCKTEKTLRETQDATKKLRHDHEEVQGLLKSEVEKVNNLNIEIKLLKHKLQTESSQAEKACQTASLSSQAEKACQTASLSSQDHREQSKAWEYEKNVLHRTIENLNLSVAQFLKTLDKNEVEMAALRQENQELQKRPSSSVKEQEEEEEKDKQVTEEPPQASSAIQVRKKKKKPSKWRRFVNVFACGVHNMEAGE